MPALTLERVIGEARALEQRLYEEVVYFEPPLDELMIVEFERDNLVRLPEDYRAFLTQIGNGSSETYGQAEGILPLDEAPRRYPVSQSELRTLMSLPFPLRNEHTCPIPVKPEELNQGHLVIGYDDYKTFYILIIEGPCRGEVWQRKLDSGFSRCARRADFFSWLENRLLYLKQQSFLSNSEGLEMELDETESDEDETKEE